MKTFFFKEWVKMTYTAVRSGVLNAGPEELQVLVLRLGSLRALGSLRGLRSLGGAGRVLLGGRGRVTLLLGRSSLGNHFESSEVRVE